MLFQHKKQWFIAAVIITATLGNVVAGVLLFGDIQVMELPETTIVFDIVELSTDAVELQVALGVNNTNDFGLYVGDLTVVTKTPAGVELDTFVVKGGNIRGGEQKTFTAVDQLRLADEIPEKLYSTISGKVGVVLYGFIRKTVDLHLTMITGVGTVMEAIASPSISFDMEITDLTQYGVNLTGAVDVYNPNTFALSFSQLTIAIETDTGVSVGHVETGSGEIPGHDSVSIPVSGHMVIEALNAETLHIQLSGDARVLFGGVEKNLPLNAIATVHMPQLEELLAPDQLADVAIWADFRCTLNGVAGDIMLETVNPTKIDLEARDIRCLLYRVDDKAHELIAETTIEDGILKAENTTVQTGEIVIPYRSLISSKGLPDWMRITITANLSLPGLDQSMYIGLTGYQDYRYFR